MTQTNQDSNIIHFTRFKSAHLPPDWDEDTSESTGRGASWSVAFHPPNEPNVQICFFHNGRSFDNEFRELFRRLLDEPEAVIFDEARSISNSQLVLQLSVLMGQAGNNQITNLSTAGATAVFHLKVLETIELGTETVLHAQGYFKKENGAPGSYFDGLFFDGSPGNPVCRVHELFFEAPSESDFLKFYPDFEKTLSSLVWK